MKRDAAIVKDLLGPEFQAADTWEEFANTLDEADDVYGASASLVKRMTPPGPGPISDEQRAAWSKRLGIDLDDPEKSTSLIQGDRMKRLVVPTW